MASFTLMMSVAFIFLTHHADALAAKVTKEARKPKSVGRANVQEVQDEANLKMWVAVGVVFFGAASTLHNARTKASVLIVTLAGFMKYLSSFSSRFPGYPCVQVMCALSHLLHTLAVFPASH